MSNLSAMTHSVKTSKRRRRKEGRQIFSFFVCFESRVLFYLKRKTPSLNTKLLAMASARTPCVVCNKERSTFKCGGCLQEFCFNHLTEHKQKLSRELDEVELNRDVLRQTLLEYTSEPSKHHLIEEINQWEHRSIKQIQQVAEEARQRVLEYSGGFIKGLEMKLNKLTDQLRQRRDENDFYETDLCQWSDELVQLTQEITKPSNINLREDRVPFIYKIVVDTIPSKYDDYFVLIIVHGSFFYFKHQQLVRILLSIQNGSPMPLQLPEEMIKVMD